jgi:hypothetical protein
VVLGNRSKPAKEVSCQLEYNHRREKSYIMATFVTIDKAKNWIIEGFNVFTLGSRRIELSPG